MLSRTRIELISTFHEKREVGVLGLSLWQSSLEEANVYFSDNIEYCYKYLKANMNWKRFAVAIAYIEELTRSSFDFPPLSLSLSPFLSLSLFLSLSISLSISLLLMSRCKKVELRSVAILQLIARLTLDLCDLQFIATFLQRPISQQSKLTNLMVYILGRFYFHYQGVKCNISGCQYIYTTLFFCSSNCRKRNDCE